MTVPSLTEIDEATKGTFVITIVQLVLLVYAAKVIWRTIVPIV